MAIRLAGVVRESLVDGPGVRYVIFAQGCAHGCKDCHNPETHDFSGGYLIEEDELISDIMNRKHIKGVTLSGGDPFFQSEEFSSLAEKIKRNNVNIMAYTGFRFEELIKKEEMMRLLKSIDILVDGPFIKEEKTLKLPYVGSKNQRVIDVKESLEKNTPVLKKFI